ncbi:fibrinogen-like protein 1 [Pseudophryne corroboree]|uniref:fibrinogen-like protein 1 n=1 Tax=Pseudophryne corroboree TaxID=495146 RepID=UPI003081B884
MTPSNTANASKNYLQCKEEQRVLEVMIWPPQRPDLNIIKAVWVYTKRQKDSSKPTSTEDLWRNEFAMLHPPWIFHVIERKGFFTACDCSDIWERNKGSPSGIYTVKPDGADLSFQVYCEITAKGGWTLVQKHNGEDGLSFEKLWEDYENGFGNLSGEHWLGLRHLHRLTHQAHRPCALRIRLGDFAGREAYAQYSPFSVGEGYYQLSAGNYSGTAGDAFRGNIGISRTNQHGSFFSTLDHPADNCYPVCPVSGILFPSCSYILRAGWWFNACGSANLNGMWRGPPKNRFWPSSVTWPTWRPYESLKFSEMYLIHN